MPQPFRTSHHFSPKPEAAEAWYRALWRACGSPLAEAKGPGWVAFEALSPALTARGVPSHWLPSWDMGPWAEALGRLEAIGAQRLGPPPPPEAPFGRVREAWGSTLGLRQDEVGRALGWGEALWPLLVAPGALAAGEAYAQLWPGLRVGEPVALGQGAIAWRRLAWPEGGQGGLLEAQGLAGVHPHWLLSARVRELAEGLAIAQAQGATLLQAPLALPEGPTLAMLDDPWGGGFGLGIW